jgi:hypothetical protein
MHLLRHRCFFVCCMFALILSLVTVATAQGPSAEATSEATAAPAPPPAAAADDGWHVALTPYLWFAGMHGTVGTGSHTTSVHASFGDIISNFNIGFMGAVEARKKKFLVSTDMIWMRLSDDKAISIGDVTVRTADVKVTQFVLTPKAGYRLVDQEKMKLDALAGLRYWHLGQEFKFSPPVFSGVSGSLNWVDVVAGLKMEMPVSQKAVITVLGDAGGGGANLDYQVAGLLGFRISKKLILQGGWRYVDVDYRGSQTAIFDVASSGFIGGVTINLK